MIRILQSSWFVSLTGCLIYLGATVLFLKPDSFAGAKISAAEIKRSPDDDPSWRFRNPEFDQWVNELKHEREALAAREQELKELAARLAAERQEITAVTQAVMQLQADFDRGVVRLKDQEAVNLKREVKVLVEMSPDAAANMLAEMSDADIARVLYLMKSDQMAAILDAWSQKGKAEARRAATVIEMMRRMLPEPSNRNLSSR